MQVYEALGEEFDKATTQRAGGDDAGVAAKGSKAGNMSGGGARDSDQVDLVKRMAKACFLDL